MAPSTPIAFIERATWPNERVVTATLDTAVAVRDDREIEPPAVIVIGEVAARDDAVMAFLRSRRVLEGQDV